MAPLECPTQRLLARGCRSIAVARQHLQPVLHRSRELLHTQQRGSRSRQLDSQRQTVKLPAQIDGCRRAGVAQHKARVRTARAFDEQRHRAECLCQRGGQRTLRHGQRADAIDPFCRQPQRRLAGDDQPQARCRIQ